jgi:ketosteroid isomerase-like protein
MASWDEEGVQMPPDKAMRVGKAAITEAMRQGFAALKFSNFVINMQEAEMLGPERGYTRGVYSYTFAPKAGGPATSYDGKFSTLWKKQADGSWKIYRDCYNSNVAPAK